MLLNRKYFLSLQNNIGKHFLVAVNINLNNSCYCLKKNGATKVIPKEIITKIMQEIDDYEILFSLDLKKELLAKIKKLIAYSNLEYRKSLREDLKKDIEILKKLIKEEEKSEITTRSKNY